MAFDGKVIIQTILDTKKATTQAKGLGSTLKSGIAKGAKVATGAMVAIGTATTATAGAMVKATKATMEYGVEVNRNSQKLNMSKKGYQEWSYVLKRSGTSIDSLRMGMKKISTAIDEARNGSKSATENFKRLGLSVQDLQGKSQEEVFGLMVKRLQGIKDTTERSAIANKFFGRSAQEMAGLLNKSGKDVEGLKKQAHDLGLVLSDDAIKKSAEFRGKLTELQSTFEGLRNKMAVNFLPSLTKVTDGLSLIAQGKTEVGLKKIEDGVREFTTQLNKMTPKILQLGGTILKSLGKGLLDNLPTLLDAGARIIATIISGIAKAIPTLIKKLPQILGAVKTALMGAFETLSKELPSTFGALARVLKNVVSLFGGFLEVLTSSSATGEMLRGVLIGLVTAYAVYKIATTLATTATKLLTLAMNTNPVILMATAIIGVVTATGLFINMMQDAFTYEDETIRKAEEAGKKYDEYSKSLKDNAKARQEAIESAEAEGNQIDFLYKKLQDLMKVEHKSKEQKEEIKSIVKQLNEKLPDLKLKYDEEKDSLNKSTKAIKKNIEARKQKIMTDAIEANAKKIAEDRAKGEERYNELVKAGTALEEERRKKEEARASAKAKAKEASDQENWAEVALQEAIAKGYDSEISKIDESIRANEKKKENAKETLNELENQYDKSYTRIANIQNKASFDKLVKNAKKAGVEIPEALKSGFATGEISLKEATTRLNNAMKLQELNKGVKGKAKKVVDDIVNAYLSGTISAEEASKQLRDAGLKGLKGKDGDAKKSGEKKRKNFKDGVEGTEKEKNDVKTSAKKGTVDQAKKGMKGGKDEGKSSGQNILKGFIAGLENGGLLTGIMTASKAVVDLILGTIRGKGGEGSPWSTTTASGEFAVEGLIKGAKNKEGELKRAYANVANTAIKSMDKQLVASSKYSAGTMQTALNTSLNANLDGIPNAVVEGIENSNLTVKIGEREMGRVVRSY